MTLLASRGWDLLAEDVSLPAAVLSIPAIDNNIRWMQSFAEQAGVKLAPHGKTTMAPDLFTKQLEMGCWAMSLATVPQIIAARRAGFSRLIMANQLVGRRSFEQIAHLLKEKLTEPKQSEPLEFYCFVDSIENANALAEFFSAAKISLNVLVEIGVKDGRCGCRDNQQVEQLCQHINTLPALNLKGLAFYEGVIHGGNAAEDVIAFVKQVKNLAIDLHAKNTFASGETIITGAGSAWYDLVAEHLNGLPDDISVVLRPGCYLVHDVGIYQAAQNAVLARKNLACDIKGALVNSLQIWAYVQSVPQPGLAIVGMGKRDVAFDAGLPQPYYTYRPASMKQPIAADPSWTVSKIMDQHCMMHIPPDSTLRPGDMVSFTTSHPCLTMDKWRCIGLIDEQFHIDDIIETCF